MTHVSFVTELHIECNNSGNGTESSTDSENIKDSTEQRELRLNALLKN